MRGNVRETDNLSDWDRLVIILSQYSGIAPNEIGRDSDLHGLGTDSLDIIGLAREIEIQYGLKRIPDQELRGSITPGSILEYIEKRKAR